MQQVYITPNRFWGEKTHHENRRKNKSPQNASVDHPFKIDWRDPPPPHELK